MTTGARIGFFAQLVRIFNPPPCPWANLTTTPYSAQPSCQPPIMRRSSTIWRNRGQGGPLLRQSPTKGLPAKGSRFLLVHSSPEIERTGRWCGVWICLNHSSSSQMSKNNKLCSFQFCYLDPPEGSEMFTCPDLFCYFSPLLVKPFFTFAPHKKLLEHWYDTGVQLQAFLLGGSSHLLSALVHPNCKRIKPTYPSYKWGELTHLGSVAWATK